MHIGFVAHNFIRGNGQGRINYEIARHALAQGHAVTLMANKVSADLTELGATWVRVRPLPHRPDLLGSWTAAANADRLLPRYRDRFDVLVGAGFTLRSHHDVNLCQFVHGAWLNSPVHVSKLRVGLHGAYQWAYTTANGRWERQAYAAAKRIVAPSERIKGELISIGVPADRITVIYNGVDPGEFFPAADASVKAGERRTLKLPPDAPLALFVGDIRTTRKNLDSVLKAMVSVPTVELVVVGEVASSPFPAMAHQLGIEKRVHFTGYSTEVRRYMRAADFFVFPSRYEAGTLVLMEAAASGLALITAKTAGGAELFEHEAIVLDDPDDVPALSHAIKAYAFSPDRRTAAGEGCLKVARSETWTKMADGYLAIFLEAANAKLSQLPQRSPRGSQSDKRLGRSAPQEDVINQ